MHPYRTPAYPAPEPAVEPDATRLAFGLALLAAGLRWLTTHRSA